VKPKQIWLPGGLGRLLYVPARHSASIPGDLIFSTNLWLAHRDRHGHLISDGRPFDPELGYDMGSGLVTHAGVRLLSQDTAISAGSATLNAMKYHGSGTGTTAAAATDTALQTAIGTTATSGTNSNADASPNATVTATATISYTSTLAVTEWGLFNSGTLSGATMWDHKVFSAVNVVSGDSITPTYVLTINSGG